MKKEVYTFPLKYVLHECSAPREQWPDSWIKIDPRTVDLHKESRIGNEIGGWILYFIDNDRIKMQHSQQELWQTIYLRHNIN